VAIRRAALAAAILVTACGGAPGAVDETTVTSLPATTTTAPATTTTVGADPVVLGLQTGRGDDGSFEIGAWISGLPVEAGTTFVVGIDADDSYPGSGDPTSDLEGYLQVSYGPAATDQRVVVDGEVVASSDDGNVSEWVSWGFSSGYLRVYFIGDVAPLAGTVWVVANPGGTGPGGTVTLDGRRAIAGVEVGYACSARGSALGVEVPPDVPDPGVVCLYP
jgi:hypothetical protein